MAVSGSEPVSVQDLGISLNGTASADGIGSQPASVDDLQLVVEGMQQRIDAIGGTWCLKGLGQISRGSAKKSANWGSSWTNVPETGTYRVFIIGADTDSYGSESAYIRMSIGSSGLKNVWTGTASDVVGGKAMYAGEVQLSAGQICGVSLSSSINYGFYAIQRIK